MLINEDWRKQNPINNILDPCENLLPIDTVEPKRKPMTQSKARDLASAS